MIKHTITALALTLSLASSAVQAQETNCDGWLAREWELVKQFWETATPETVADCLNSGSSVSARSRFGIAPVHFASEISENPDVITVLLEAGADINTRAEDGFTPLHITVRNNENLDVITVLLEAGADVNARDGVTPLHWAAEYNENPEVITVLLDNGSDGTAVDKDGKTPFDLAKENEALAGTDAYWALNDAQYK
jgi:ankyrin repeat protein